MSVLYSPLRISCESCSQFDSLHLTCSFGTKGAKGGVGAASAPSADAHALRMLAMSCCCNVEWRRDDAPLLAHCGLLAALQTLVQKRASRAVVLDAFVTLATGCFGWESFGGSRGGARGSCSRADLRDRSVLPLLPSAEAAADAPPMPARASVDLLHGRLCDTILCTLELELARIEGAARDGALRDAAQRATYAEDERACFAVAKLLLAALERRAASRLDAQRALRIVDRLLRSCSSRLQLIAARTLAPLAAMSSIGARELAAQWLQGLGALLCGEGTLCATPTLDACAAVPSAIGAAAAARAGASAAPAAPLGPAGAGFAVADAAVPEAAAAAAAAAAADPIFVLVVHPSAHLACDDVVDAMERQHAQDSRRHTHTAPVSGFAEAVGVVESRDPNGSAMKGVWLDFKARLRAVEQRCEALGYGAAAGAAPTASGAVFARHTDRRRLAAIAERYCIIAAANLGQVGDVEAVSFNYSITVERVGAVQRRNAALEAQSARGEGLYRRSGFERLQLASELVRVLRTLLRGESGAGRGAALDAFDDDSASAAEEEAEGEESAASAWCGALGAALDDALAAQALGDLAASGGGRTARAHRALGSLAVLGGETILEVRRPGGAVLATLGGTQCRATLVDYAPGQRLATIVVEAGGSRGGDAPVPIPVAARDVRPVAAVPLGGAATFALTPDRLRTLVKFLRATDAEVAMGTALAASASAPEANEGEGARGLWIVSTARALAVNSIFNMCKGESASAVAARRRLLAGDVPDALPTLANIASAFATKAHAQGVDAAQCGARVCDALSRALDCTQAGAPRIASSSWRTLTPFQRDARARWAAVLRFEGACPAVCPSRWAMAFGHGFAFASPTEVAAKPAPMYDNGERRAPRDGEEAEEAVVVANCAVPPSARAYYWELTVNASRPGVDEAPLDLLVGLFPEALIPTPNNERGERGERGSSGGGDGGGGDAMARALGAQSRAVSRSARPGPPSLMCGPGAKFLSARRGRRVWHPSRGGGGRRSEEFARLPVNVGDTVGCLWDMVAGRLYFSVNGKNVLSPPPPSDGGEVGGGPPRRHYARAAFEGDELRCTGAGDPRYRPCVVLSRNTFQATSTLSGQAFTKDVFQVNFFIYR